jgi:hypothetical protein
LQVLGPILNEPFTRSIGRRNRMETDRPHHDRLGRYWRYWRYWRRWRRHENGRQDNSSGMIMERIHFPMDSPSQRKIFQNFEERWPQSDSERGSVPHACPGRFEPRVRVTLAMASPEWAVP